MTLYIISMVILKFRSDLCVLKIVFRLCANVIILMGLLIVYFQHFSILRLISIYEGAEDTLYLLYFIGDRRKIRRKAFC